MHGKPAAGYFNRSMQDDDSYPFVNKDMKCILHYFDMRYAYETRWQPCGNEDILLRFYRFEGQPAAIILAGQPEGDDGDELGERRPQVVVQQHVEKRPEVARGDVAVEGQGGAVVPGGVGDHRHRVAVDDVDAERRGADQEGGQHEHGRGIRKTMNAER